jgi:hypothetical protein
MSRRKKKRRLRTKLHSIMKLWRRKVQSIRFITKRRNLHFQKYRGKMAGKTQIVGTSIVAAIQETT